jgi:hypothetical protein
LVISVLKTSTAALYSCHGLGLAVGETTGALTGAVTSVLSVAIAATDEPSTSEVLRTTAAKVFFSDIFDLFSLV